MSRHASRSKKSYKKSAVLIVALVLTVILYQQAPRVIESIVTVLDESQSAAVGQMGDFSEAQVDSIRQSMAGFWVLEEKGSADSLLSGLNDRIEILENGIVWRVRTETLHLPRGKIVPLVHIYQAMVIPFARADSGRAEVVSDVQYLKRAWIVGSDTCYVPCHKVLSPMFQKQDTTEYIRTGVESWKHAMGSDRLLLNGEEYTSYGDGDLATFFPEGAIDIVDAIAIRKCPESFTRGRAIRDAVVASVDGLESTGTDLAEIRMMLNSLYAPEVLLPLMGADRPRRGADGTALKLGFTLAQDGTVSHVDVRSPVFRFREQLRETVVDEVSEWRFPASTSTDERLIEYNFHF